MVERESFISRLRRRTGTPIIILVVLGALLLLAVLFFRQVGSLFNPQYNPGGGADAQTTDVRVERGKITKTISIYGMIEPKQRSTLSFQHAMARVLDVPAFPGQQVAKGDILVALDEPALQRALAELRADLQDAQDELEELQADSGDTRRLRLQEDLAQAENDRIKAEQALAAYKRGEDTPAKRREAAQRELAKAQADLVEVRDNQQRQERLINWQDDYNKAVVKHAPYPLIKNPSEIDLDIELSLRHNMLDKLDKVHNERAQWAVDIRTAEQAVAAAQAKLDTLDRQIAAGAARVEQAKLEATVNTAKVRVQQIKADLDSLDSSPVDVDVAEARAEVLKLQGQVDDARTALDEAVLVAPFDGIVDEVKVSPNSTVTPGTEALTLFNGASFRAVAQVSDVDVTYLKQGGQVQVAFSAFPLEPVTGTVAEVPRVGRYMGGQTVFDVPIEFEVPAAGLLSGMSADIKVPLYDKEDVVLLPMMALQYGPDGPFVIVVNGRRTEQRPVKLGINDGVQTEVTEGLQEGETVRTIVYGPRGF